MALHIASSNDTGRESPMSWEEIAQSCSSVEQIKLVEAIYELQQSGLVRLSNSINVRDGIYSLRPAITLFQQFDLEANGFDFDEDVVTLATLLLEDNSLGNAEALHRSTGWPVRRFNPPFARILSAVHPGHVRQTVSPRYPSLGLSIGPGDIVSLRRLIESIQTRESQLKEAAKNRLLQGVERVELALRALLVDTFGNDLKTIPKTVFEKAKDRMRGSNLAALDLVGLVEYLTLGELFSTIRRKTIWPMLQLQENKDTFSRRSEQLMKLRNCLSHNRAPSEVERLEGEAAIIWFLSVLAVET
ncbi:MAG: hypothetical protein AAF358_00570 [Pseudomonadota bacterium]